jgi:tRNA1(Val) A37 N6-methylase TrmN6
VLNGSVPDHKSHQFYPTPAVLAMEAVNLAEIGPTHLCLEPSAGQGALAVFMPRDRTTMVEISRLFCNVLEAKGCPHVVCADFLKFDSLAFDRVIMNPPYADGRWGVHLEHAFKLLKNDGILIAILPASCIGKTLLKNVKTEWSKIYENEFDNTSVNVVIGKFTRTTNG